MNPPIAPLKRLTLEDMTPRSSQSQAGRDLYNPGDEDVEYDTENTDIESDASSDGEEEDQDPGKVESPTRLVYNLETLPDKMKSAVRDTFSEPPTMAVQHCRQMGDTYAFQMTEVVTRSIRIRAPSSGETRLSCSCGQGNIAEDDDEPEPCQHLLWFLDQLAKQTMYRENNQNHPFTMTSAGFPKEMGDPFQAITENHLNIVAKGLHCHVIDPQMHGSRSIDKLRIAESRELLSSVHEAISESFRPDIFDRPLLGPPMIKPRDLDYTVFRMLQDNDSFFHYFLSTVSRQSPLIQQFRLLSHRVNAVMSDLEARAAARDHLPTGADAADPRTVAWAARHIQGVVELVHRSIFQVDRPLEQEEKEEAARTLVHVLDAVVQRNIDYQGGGRRSERNLYLRLIGDVDQNFVMQELEGIPDGAVPFRQALEELIDDITRQGAPVSYVTRLRKFVAELQTRRSSTSLKRNVTSRDSEGSAFKRMR